LNFLFAWRYFKAKKTTNAINIISWISIVAIVIGTASLILVLSVFNGFEGLVKSLYSSFYSDVKISAASGKEVVLTPEQLQKIKSVKGVKAVSLFVEEKALLQNKADDTDSADFQSIIYLKGVDSNYTSVTTVADNLIGNARFNTGTEDQPLLILGSGVENAVHVRSESNIRPLAIYMPRKGAVSMDDPLQSLSTEAVNTSGTFVIQQDFDNKYAITNLPFVKRMLVMEDNTFSGAEIAVTDGTDADDVRDQIKNFLGKNYLIQNRFEQNASLFSVMRIEKWIIYAILSLILIVAAFNMVGALTMLVLEKKQDIAVLHALGAGRGFIQKIFLSEGLLLAVIGGGTGMFLAFIIGILQIKLHLVPLEGSTFLIDYFPVKMVLSDFLLVAFTVLVIALVASWLPARKAALQQFVLREE
jgi:lipoprotein-releasing system permease protein